jgi:hypothetical protein
LTNTCLTNARVYVLIVIAYHLLCAELIQGEILMKKFVYCVILAGLLLALASMVDSAINCVTCVDTDCTWDMAYDHSTCTEFAGGNGCIASGSCVSNFE